MGSATKVWGRTRSKRDSTPPDQLRDSEHRRHPAIHRLHHVGRSESVTRRCDKRRRLCLVPARRCRAGFELPAVPVVEAVLRRALLQRRLEGLPPADAESRPSLRLELSGAREVEPHERRRSIRRWRTPWRRRSRRTSRRFRRRDDSGEPRRSVRGAVQPEGRNHVRGRRRRRQDAVPARQEQLRSRASALPIRSMTSSCSAAASANTISNPNNDWQQTNGFSTSTNIVNSTTAAARRFPASCRIRFRTAFCARRVRRSARRPSLGRIRLGSTRASSSRASGSSRSASSSRSTELHAGCRHMWEAAATT